MSGDLKWYAFPNERPKYEGHYIVTVKSIKDDTLKTSIALWEDDSFQFVIADFCSVGEIVTGFAEFPKPFDCYADVTFIVETMKKSTTHDELLKCYKQAQDALWLVYHKRLNELVKDFQEPNLRAAIKGDEKINKKAESKASKHNITSKGTFLGRQDLNQILRG